MKTGILTWYDVLNYGSAFQAYALQKTIENFGIETEILVHDRKLPDYCGNRIREYSLKNVLKWIRNQTPNRIKNRKCTSKKLDAFKKFRAEYLNIGKHYSETDADFVIIGSDQIFDVNGMYYPFQFGESVTCDYVTTYAPSFGETTLEKIKNHPEYENICKSIKSLKNVNARDWNTQEILNDILQKEIQITIDPTLLYDFKNEKEKWNSRLVKEKYCVIYSWGGITTSAEFANQCQKFAKKHQLKLVSVGEIRKWCDIQYASASPVEFFQLFMHAEMVLTNMFHGTCFSIVMEKPFYSFVMSHNQNKLAGLLQYLGLETQLVSDLNEFSQFSVPKLDYSNINERLKIERVNSSKELKRSLGMIS